MLTSEPDQSLTPYPFSDVSQSGIRSPKVRLPKERSRSSQTPKGFSARAGFLWETSICLFSHQLQPAAICTYYVHTQLWETANRIPLMLSCLRQVHRKFLLSLHFTQASHRLVAFLPLSIYLKIRKPVEATPLRGIQLQLVPTIPPVKCRIPCLMYVPLRTIAPTPTSARVVRGG